MKTKYFLTNGLETEEKEYLKYLQEAKDPLYKNVLNWFNKQDSLPRVTETVIRKFAIESKQNSDIIYKTINSILWTIRLFSNSIEDSPELFYEDLEEYCPELLIDKEMLKARISEIYEIAKRWSVFIKIQLARKSGAPMISGSSASIIKKPVFDKKFDFDEIDIKEYTPKLLKYTHCVLIELQNTRDEYFSFQLDSQSFERMLNELIALQIELKAIKNDGM